MVFLTRNVLSIKQIRKLRRYEHTDMSKKSDTKIREKFPHKFLIARECIRSSTFNMIKYNI